MHRVNSIPKKASKRDLRLLGLWAFLIIAAVLTWVLSGPWFSTLSSGKINSNSTRTGIEADKNLPTTFKSIQSNDTVVWQQTLQSIIVLNKQIASEPQVPSYHNRLGILYAQIGDFSAAAKQFKEAISLSRLQMEDRIVQTKSTDKAAKTDLALLDRSTPFVQLSCAHSNLARIYDKLGDHARVVMELEELNKDVAFAGDAHVSKLAAENFSHLSNGQKKLTASEALLLARAEALRHVGRLNEASQEYVNLIKSNPKLAIAHQRLALTAISENNLWLAINELETAAKLDLKDADTQNDLGLVYEQIGDYKSAQRAFLNAHNIDARHLSASINLSNLIANNGNYKSGIAIMRQATVSHPRSGAAYNNLAALIARTGNQTEAAKVFAKAINLDPTLPSAHYGLGLALLKLKSYPAAIKEFQTAMTLNPGILDLQNKIDLANRCNLRSLALYQTAFN